MPRSDRCSNRYLAIVAAQDLFIADRNFCTTDFLFGIAGRGRFLRDPTTRLDTPLGVRRQAAGVRPDRDRQGL